jgi:hypothetical protein
MHNIFTRIGCTLFTCDMFMCRLRHINDSVLSSLKMEGIRAFLLVLSLQKKDYSFRLMVEASDHGYVLHTRRIHVTRYRIRYDMISDLLE